jgi:uncharacterized protein (TIGR03435 family)
MGTDVRLPLREAVAAALVVALASLCVQAQTTKPRFETAAIRPATERNVDLRSAGQWVRPGGVFTVTRVTVATLLSYAYGLKGYQIVGGPEWLRRDTYAIDARAGREVTEDEAKVMLQSLLEERFTLAVHTEEREMRVRTLVLANADGRLGPYIKRMEICTPEARAEAQKQFPPRTIESSPRNGFATGSCTDLAIIETFLTQVSDVPVLDRTGLSGKFTYDLRFQSSSDSGGLRTIAPELIDALREQLGLALRLEQARLPVMLIDSIDRPSEN